jgi:MFS family permease
VEVGGLQRPTGSVSAPGDQRKGLLQIAGPIHPRATIAGRRECAGQPSRSVFWNASAVSSQTDEPVTGGFAAYRSVLRAPRVMPALVASVLARLPTGMGGIALILFVHESTGSFATAGVVAGAFSVGLGGTGPLLARLIDRRGTGPILVPAAFLSSAALAAIPALGKGTSVAALIGLAALAGAAMPPYSGLLRRRWPELVSDSQLDTAYAIDAILMEVIFITGPLLTGLLAAATDASVGLYAAAALGAIGVIAFAPLGRVPAPNEAKKGHWLGALATPSVLLLALSGVPLAATFGAFDVALPAFGAAHGSVALGGPFTAAIACGSALGGIAYGARPGSMGPPKRALPLLAALLALFCLPALLAASVAEMLVCAAMAGLFIAPIGTVQSRIIQASAPVATATEAFTWISLATTLGVSLGSALAGPLVESGGWRAGAIAAFAFATSGAMLVASSKRVLKAASDQPLGSDLSPGGRSYVKNTSENQRCSGIARSR